MLGDGECRVSWCARYKYCHSTLARFELELVMAGNFAILDLKVRHIPPSECDERHDVHGGDGGAHFVAHGAFSRVLCAGQHKAHSKLSGKGEQSVHRSHCSRSRSQLDVA